MPPADFVGVKDKCLYESVVIGRSGDVAAKPLRRLPIANPRKPKENNCNGCATVTAVGPLGKKFTISKCKKLSEEAISRLFSGEDPSVSLGKLGAEKAGGLLGDAINKRDFANNASVSDGIFRSFGIGEETAREMLEADQKNGTDNTQRLLEALARGDDAGAREAADGLKEAGVENINLDSLRDNVSRMTIADKLAALPSEARSDPLISSICSISDCTKRGTLFSQSTFPIRDSANASEDGSAPAGTPINARMTYYAPGAGGRVEGPFATSRPNLDGQYVPRTLDDVRLGRSAYVTLASDASNYGKFYDIGTVTYTSPIDGKMYTLENVVGYTHDTGSAFRGKPDKFDVAVGDFRGWSPRAASSFVASSVGRTGTVRELPSYASVAPPQVTYSSSASVFVSGIGGRRVRTSASPFSNLLL